MRQCGDLVKIETFQSLKAFKSDYTIWYQANLEEWQIGKIKNGRMAKLTWHGKIAIYSVKSKGLNDSCIFSKLNRCDGKFLLESNLSKLPIKWTGEGPNQPVKIQITFADF